MAPGTESSDGPAPQIFSIGYEGKSLEEFIALLKGALVERLIDDRNASSRSRIRDSTIRQRSADARLRAG